MAFLTSTQTLSQAWEDAQSIARQLKSAAQAMKDTSLGAATASTRVLHFERELRSYHGKLAVIGALPDITEYVTALPDTPLGYDVALEFTTMQNTIAATVTWIRNNFPKEIGGYLLAQTWGANGPVDRTFTSAELAGLRTQIDALLVYIG